MLCEEQVRAFDDVLEVGLALRIHQSRNVGDVDSFRSKINKSALASIQITARYIPSTTRHEKVCLEPEMSAIAEIRTVHDDLARGQLDVLVFDANEVSILAELRRIKVRNGYTSVREADKFFTVKTLRVSEHTASVDDRDRLIVAEKNLV